jgi:hypothetical protein
MAAKMAAAYAALPQTRLDKIVDENGGLAGMWI